MRDSICLGLVSGSIGHLARGVFNFTRFLKPQHTWKRETHRNNSFADFMAGSIFGIPLVYFMKKTGKDQDLAKGAGFGILLWALFYGAKRTHTPYHLRPRKCHRSELMAFLGHLVFGVVTARAAVKLADPETFPDDEEYDFGF